MSTGRSSTCEPRKDVRPGRDAGRQSSSSPIGGSTVITERSLCYIGFVMSRRDERKEATRAELVEAAARVFARRGFHGASVDQIARGAGSSTVATDCPFEGKDALFLGVYEPYATARVREGGDARDSAEGEPPQRARAY